MSFDEVLAKLTDRCNRYMTSKDPSVILGEDALTDARALARAVSDHARDISVERPAVPLQAAIVLGGFHYLRFEHSISENDFDLAELAAAVHWLNPMAEMAHMANLADVPKEVIPAGLQLIMGPKANPATQADIAKQLLDRALTTDRMPFLEAAIGLHKAALRRFVSGTPEQVQALSNLCVAYRVRYERLGDYADLDQAVGFGREAMGAAAGEDRAKVAHNAASVCLRRHESLGDAADLEQAMAWAELAVDLMKPNAFADALSLLANGHRARFYRTGAINDLELAVDLGEHAVAAAEDDRDRAVHCSSASINYQVSFHRTQNAEHLERAVVLAQEAVDLTPKGHPAHASYLAELGTILRDRFDVSGDVRDLDQAVETGARSLLATPENDWSMAHRLSDLCWTMLARYGNSRRAEDLANAAEFATEAAELADERDPNRAMFLATLGSVYRTQLDADPGSVARTQVRDLADQLSQVTSEPSPAGMAVAAFQTGALANAVAEYPIAVKLLDKAVSLLPLIPPRESGWADQEYSLSRYSGLIAEAVSAHCASGDPEGAVRVAEQGRAVILAARLDARTDLAKLRETHPTLAVRFRELRHQLDSSSMPGVRTPRLNAMLEGRRRLWAAYDALVAEIRQQDQFADFLMPPEVETLVRAADGGAVVVINAGRHRGDAIIVTPDGSHRHVPLTRVRLSDVAAQAARLIEASNGGTLTAKLRMTRVVPQVLSWLWNDVVGPVIDALPPSLKNRATPPRVWWMPIGVLSLLPLHAAGHEDGPSSLDHVVSSYIPTLRALAHARATVTRPDRRQLVIALERTQGLTDLPGTATEARFLHHHHPESPFLLNEEATVANVLSALPESTWSHFACHASIDVNSPSRGGLQLADGVLPVSEISRLHLTEAELAYLSACSTATPGWRHIDEAIQLASAFQVAGFRHVIASLWPLNDDNAATAAHTFYEGMADAPTVDKAAYALHAAVRRLRADNPTSPHLWAPLIHSGP